PGIGFALLPKLACPMCWPLYAGILSSLGLGFLIGTTYLVPLTIGFLAAALVVLGFRAKQRRGFGPPGHRDRWLGGDPVWQVPGGLHRRGLRRCDRSPHSIHLEHLASERASALSLQLSAT